MKSQKQLQAIAKGVETLSIIGRVLFRLSPWYYLLTPPPPVPPLSMLKEIRNDIQPSKPKHWKGKGGGGEGGLKFMTLFIALLECVICSKWEKFWDLTMSTFLQLPVANGVSRSSLLRKGQIIMGIKHPRRVGIKEEWDVLLYSNQSRRSQNIYLYIGGLARRRPSSSNYSFLKSYTWINKSTAVFYGLYSYRP